MIGEDGTAWYYIKSEIESTQLVDGDILSLKREKNEATEVRAGTECGISIKDFDGFEVGDFIEVYNVEEVAQSL